MTRVESQAIQKGLPASVEAEEWVLGSILLDGYIPPEAQELGAQDFSIEKHRRVFGAILALADLNRPIEDKTVVEVLRDRGELPSCDGIAGVASLTQSLPQLSSIAEYVRVVGEKAKLRQLVCLADALGKGALECKPSADLIATFQARLDSLSHASNSVEAYTVETLDREFQRYADNIDQERVRLGFPRLDELTGGIAPGEVITFLARTTVGKSAIVQNIIPSVLDDQEAGGVVFFSLEMPRLQVWQRQLQVFAGVHGDAVLHSYRNATGRARNDEFVERYAGRLLIADDTAMDLGAMRRFVRGRRRGQVGGAGEASRHRLSRPAGPGWQGQPDGAHQRFGTRSQAGGEGVGSRRSPSGPDFPLCRGRLRGSHDH